MFRYLDKYSRLFEEAGKMQIFVDEAHIRIISKDRKSAQRKMMRGLHSRLRK